MRAATEEPVASLGGVLAAVVALLLSAVVAPPAGAQPAELRPPPTIGSATVPAGWPDPPPVTADAYLLADLASGQVLAARAGDDPRPAASTVKVLTAITVLRRTRLTDVITAGPEADGFAADAAGVGLDAGDRWSVEDLLEGLVARSGNDAAAALATSIGGTVEGFVELMRRDAALLGLAPTLATPDGLADANRLSAADLLVLTRAALADPRFAAIAARPVVELPGVGPIASRNELLSTYPGADGVKTGYTAASGRCLVASAERDGRHLVAVVLGSDGPTDHFADARALLDHGFAGFRSVEVAGPGPEVRLKVPGGWVELDATPARLHVPQGAGVVHRTELPVGVGGPLAASVQITWEEQTIGELALEGSSPGTAGARGPGAWLAGRAYEAMRAATNGGLWPGRTS